VFVIVSDDSSVCTPLCSVGVSDAADKRIMSGCVVAFAEGIAFFGASTVFLGSEESVVGSGVVDGEVDSDLVASRAGVSEEADFESLFFAIFLSCSVGREDERCVFADTPIGMIMSRE
jgi:hypothetical protein